MVYHFPAQSYTAWGVGLSVAHFLGISTTIFRLYHRIKERRMWLDDYVIILPLLADCVGYGIQMERMKKRFPPACNIMESFWIMIVFFMTVLWISRMSLAFSIARLFPGRPEKKFGICLGLLFLGCCLASLGITAVTCQPPEGLPWYLMDGNSCVRTGNGHIIGGLSLLTIEVGSDLVLVGYPLFVLWRVRLPRRQRRLVMAALSGSILTILATVVLAVFWYNTWNLGPDYWLISTGVANIEGAVALMVCNLLFITMFIYRYTRRNSGDSEDQSTQGSSTTSANRVTTDRPDRRLSTVPESSGNRSFTDLMRSSGSYSYSSHDKTTGLQTSGDEQQDSFREKSASDDSNTKLKPSS